MPDWRRAVRFVDSNLNTLCPALQFGTIVDCATDNGEEDKSKRCMADVGVPTSDDENDDDNGVKIRIPGE
jgi:hypothetical protein